MTAPYRVHARTHEVYKDEVLISQLNSLNLAGTPRRIFNHELIFLSPNYKGAETPANYRDWLDLIYESIHNPAQPRINTAHAGIRRVTELVSYENISPEEWEEAKIEASRRKVIQLERDEERKTIARNAIAKGYDDQTIADITGIPPRRHTGTARCPELKQQGQI
ncbi:MAG: hypothetical protein OHK0039_41030 [Bacteroidia bacterium]